MVASGSVSARWYDPNVGRFMGIDPVGYTSKNDVMSFNRYLYANNNPYKYVDPNGEFIFTAIAIASFAYSAYDGYQSGGASGAIAEASGFNDAVAGYNSIKNGDVSGAAWNMLAIACKSCKAAKKVTKKLDSTIYRRGTSLESPTRLNRKALEAEKKINNHGVSGTTTKPRGACSSASCSDLEAAGFKVTPSPSRADPGHVTIGLPKPMTKEATKKFNDAFGRVKGGK